MEDNNEKIGRIEQIVIEMIKLKTPLPDIMRVLAASIDALGSGEVVDKPTLEKALSSVMRTPMNVRAALDTDMRMYGLLQLMCNAINDECVNQSALAEAVRKYISENNICVNNGKLIIDTGEEEASELLGKINSIVLNGAEYELGGTDVKRVNLGYELYAKYDIGDVYYWGDVRLTTVVEFRTNQSFYMYAKFKMSVSSDFTYARYGATFSKLVWTCNYVAEPDDTSETAEKIRAVFHDNVASASANGLMSSEDKSKLDATFNFELISLTSTSHKKTIEVSDKTLIRVSSVIGNSIAVKPSKLEISTEFATYFDDEPGDNVLATFETSTNVDIKATFTSMVGGCLLLIEMAKL